MERCFKALLEGLLDMRHSSLDLTMNVYTDPQLLDVAGALERLPELNVPAQNDDAMLQRTA